MPEALALVASFAALAWLSAALHAAMLVQHRRPEITIFQLVVGGYRFFSVHTFSASGQRLHRRFMASVLAFVGCLVLLMVVGVVQAR
jgi:hypothetical protein